MQSGAAFISWMFRAKQREAELKIGGWGERDEEPCLCGKGGAYAPKLSPERGS